MIYPKINNYKLTAEGMYLNLCEVNPSNVNEKFKLIYSENKKEFNNKLITALCGKKNILFFSNNKDSILKKELVVIVPKDNLIWIHTLYSR